MPFALKYVYDLFESLWQLEQKSPRPKPSILQAQYNSIISQWFDHFRPLMLSTNADLTALFSILFPELRVDRVYNLREDSLARVFGRCLLLGTSRQKILTDWRNGPEKDFGAAVERVMRMAENAVTTNDEDITIEVLEAALTRLGNRSMFSEGGHKGLIREKAMAHTILGPILLRLSSRDGKWLARTILKNYLPVVIPERLTMYSYHFLLPYLYSFQNDLRKALTLLNHPLFKLFPFKPPKQDMHVLLEGATKLLNPQVGIRLKRPEFLKARSCKEAQSFAKGHRMSMERKYDGEYCQIHVNLSLPKSEQIKIFSKSGRDSTEDRKGIHSTLIKALRFHKPYERGFKTKCILEGELVVYCQKEQRILEFHHLRSHVTRAGLRLGANTDEKPDFANENLMIIFYDLLLVDDTHYFAYSYDRRVSALTDIIIPIRGQAELCERWEIDFSQANALEELRRSFVEGITKRYEGFVLKPCGMPYLSFGTTGNQFIKLKKDYIEGLGDTADFAVIGAANDPERSKQRVVEGVELNTFHVGCLENKQEVARFGAKPIFKLVFTVTYNIQKKDLIYMNRLAYFKAKPYIKDSTAEEYIINIPRTLQVLPMKVYFPAPFVFEITGGGFDKPSNCDFYVLRWPRVVKIHWDRDFNDAIDFIELQDLAELTRKQPDNGWSQEERQWLKKLEEKDIKVGTRGKRSRGAGPTGEASGSKKLKKDTLLIRKYADVQSTAVLKHDVSLVRSISPSKSHLSSLDPNYSSSSTEYSQSTPSTSPQALRINDEDHSCQSSSQSIQPRIPLADITNESISSPELNHSEAEFVQKEAVIAPPTTQMTSATSAAFIVIRDSQNINATVIRSPLHGQTIFLIDEVEKVAELCDLLNTDMHRPKAVYNWKELLLPFWHQNRAGSRGKCESGMNARELTLPVLGSAINDLEQIKAELLPFFTLTNADVGIKTIVLLTDSRTSTRSGEVIKRIRKQFFETFGDPFWEKGLNSEGWKFRLEIYCWRILKYQGSMKWHHEDWKRNPHVKQQKFIWDWDLYHMARLDL